MKKIVTLLISMMTVSLINTPNVHAQIRPAARKPVAPAAPSVSTRSTSTGATTIPKKNVASATGYTRSLSAPVRSTALPVYSKASRFQVGFRAGLNLTTIGGFDFSAIGTGLQPARVMGFHAGAMMNIGGPTVSVQPEILFSQYGVRTSAGADYLQLKYSLIEVPVLIKATFGQPSLRFFVNAGPVVAYTIGGTVSFQDAGQSGSEKIDMTNNGRLSYGASGGSGVVLRAGPGSVLLEARYTYLFSKNESGVKLNPQNFMVSAGYLIPLSGR